MKKIMLQLKSEEGSVIVVALIIMVLLLIMGINATNMSTIESQILRNAIIYKQTFYSAEAAREYVPPRTALYFGANVDPYGPGINFPNPDAPEEKISIGSQSFNGNVKYVGSTQPPRGSGDAAGQYKAHRYEITANGYVNDAKCTVEAGFYRLGL